MNDLQHYMTKCGEYRKRIAELEEALEEIFERVAGSAFYQTERKILEIKRIAEQVLRK